MENEQLKELSDYISRYFPDMKQEESKKYATNIIQFFPSSSTDTLKRLAGYTNIWTFYLDIDNMLSNFNQVIERRNEKELINCAKKVIELCMRHKVGKESFLEECEKEFVDYKEAHQWTRHVSKEMNLLKEEFKYHYNNLDKLIEDTNDKVIRYYNTKHKSLINFFKIYLFKRDINKIKTKIR